MVFLIVLSIAKTKPVMGNSIGLVRRFRANSSSIRQSAPTVVVRQTLACRLFALKIQQSNTFVPIEWLVLRAPIQLVRQCARKRAPKMRVKSQRAETKTSASTIKQIHIPNSNVNVIVSIFFFFSFELNFDFLFFFCSFFF